MPLMDRLKGTFFHELSPMDQQEQIKSLQLLRTNEIRLAKVVKRKPRKASAKKAPNKKKRTSISAETKALKALEKLSPDQLINLNKLMEKQ